MTRPAQIAALLLRTALAMLLLVQAANAAATALRMEVNRSGGDGGFIVICTPNGPKTVVISDLSPTAPESGFECECPSATQCGSAALAPPGAGSAENGPRPRPGSFAGAGEVSAANGARISMHPGSPRSPPAHSV